MGWTEAQKAELINLALSNEFNYADIARKMNKNDATVRHQAKKLGLPSKIAIHKKGQWNIKHAHLREPLLRYYLTHSAEECQKHFKLSPGEFKSCLTYAYISPNLKHIRKETRTHEPWSLSQLLFLLRHSGLRPRSWIAKKLKRGNAHSCIKERLERLGIASRTINGLTLSQFRSLFGKEPKYFIKTDAGPGRGKNSSTYFKIVPWVYLAKDLKANRLKTSRPMRNLIYSMALFQEWIFEGNALVKIKKIEKKIKRYEFKNI